MAKATLPTNYKDDIMASSMAGKRRYNLIQNSDGTVSLEDVTDYTQVGSNFGAAQMNQTNTAVNNSADKSKIIDSLADVAANTQPGMMAGALAVRELNSNLEREASRINSFASIVNPTLPYKAPACGFAMVYIQSKAGTTGLFYAKIGGRTFRLQAPGGGVTTGCAPVYAGESITLESDTNLSGYTFYFIPFR